jgi:peroxiredoxin
LKSHRALRHRATVPKAVPAVGEAAPGLELPSHDGRTIALDDSRGREHVVLYFGRAATCTNMLRHARQLARMKDALARRGATAAIVLPASRRAAAAVARLLRTPYPVLADRTRTAHAAFGLPKSLVLLQHSGTFIVDKAGVLRYALRAADPRRAFDRSALLRALDRLE